MCKYSLMSSRETFATEQEFWLRMICSCFSFSCDTWLICLIVVNPQADKWKQYNPFWSLITTLGFTRQYHYRPLTKLWEFMFSIVCVCLFTEGVPSDNYHHHYRVIRPRPQSTLLSPSPGHVQTCSLGPHHTGRPSPLESERLFFD